MLRETGKREEADLLYFRTSDIAPADQVLQARGVVFLRDPHVIHSHPHGSSEWMAFFEDDEGRPLALHAVT